ncbi:MAG: hypothetical protein WC761_02240 [Candidatus Paceibacterota bacterium]|jgi:hypothetical protein
MTSEEYNYRGLKFICPKLSAIFGTKLFGYNTFLETKETPAPDAEPFCISKFNAPNPLIKVIGEVWNASNFCRPDGLRILDMPIKMAYNNEYRMPPELDGFYSTIADILNYEHRHNPYVDQCYAYLTIDQGLVMPGTTQRNPGCHVDGFQGARITEKTVVNRSYVASCCLPTVFYNHGFDLTALDPSKHDFFLEMDRLAQEENAFQPNPFQIVLMNAYTVHRAVIAHAPVYRTFFRLSYDVKIFDRLGNTHNPMFNYNWNMVERDVHDSLTAYVPGENQ